MKLCVPLSLWLLLPTLANAGPPQRQSDIPGGRLAGCFFAKTFESGTLLFESGEDSFKVVAGAEVRCFTGCNLGGEFTATFTLGSITAGSTESNNVCESTTKFNADADYTSLGWSVTSDSTHFSFGLTCFCTDDGSNFAQGGGNGCFSESSSVQVRGKGDVAMKDLELGDHVLTGKNTYEPIYSFGHRRQDAEMLFYEITTSADTSLVLEMTGNHMVLAVDNQGQTHATRADHLQLGDRLLHVASEKVVTVTGIQTVEKMGMYMPLTPSGVLVVGGILASNYISISDTAPGVVDNSQLFFSSMMNEQTLSHWWMSPFRMLCMGVSKTFCSNGLSESSIWETQEGDQGILPWLLMGRHFAHVAENRPTLVRLLLGLPTVLIFGSLNGIEHVFLGPSRAPLLFLATLIALIVVLRKSQKKMLGNDFERSDGYSLLVRSNDH